jgi:hypothetical protein
MNLNIEQERKDFERSINGVNFSRFDTEHLGDNGDTSEDKYIFAVVQACFDGWLAAKRAALSQPQQEPVRQVPLSDLKTIEECLACVEYYETKELADKLRAILATQEAK